MFNRKLFQKNNNYTVPEVKPIDFTMDEYVDDFDIDKIRLKCKKNKVLLTKMIDNKRVKKTLDELKEELEKLNL